MKPIVIILFGLFSNFIVFGQIQLKPEEQNPLNIQFTGDKENIVLEQIIDSVGGKTRESIEIEIEVKQRVEKDYLLKVLLEDITSDKGDITIITETFSFSKEELNTPGVKKRNIELDIAKVDSETEVSKTAKLIIKIDGVEDNKNELFRYISLKSEKKEDESSTNELWVRALDAADSVDVSSMKLIVDDKNQSKFKYLRDSSYKDSSFIVDEVRVYFEEGKISRIIVIPIGLQSYFETNYPISATSFHTRLGDKIFYRGREPKIKGAYIPVGSILSYIGLSPRKRFPPDGKVILKPSDPIKTLRFKRNPLSFFDVRAYTDPLGLNGTPNGLVQTTANAEFILNTQNLNSVTFFSNVRVGIDWSRFDSKFDTLSFQSLTNRKDNELLRIQQQANFNFFIDFDVFKVSRVHDLSVSVGHHFSLTNLTDTNSRFARAVTPSFFGSINSTLYATPWIQMDLKFPFFATYFHDNVFDNYSKEFDFYISPELEIRIKPARIKEPNESSNVSLFARAKYFDMINSRGNNFLQLQTGVSISLNDLFK